MADLDTAIGGLIPGDNVVWVGDNASVLQIFEDALLAERIRRKASCIYVQTEVGDRTRGGLTDRSRCSTLARFISRRITAP